MLCNFTLFCLCHSMFITEEHGVVLFPFHVMRMLRFFSAYGSLQYMQNWNYDFFCCKHYSVMLMYYQLLCIMPHVLQCFFITSIFSWSYLGDEWVNAKQIVSPYVFHTIIFNCLSWC